MHLDELRGLITNSTPTDWHAISCWGVGSATSYRYALDKSTGGGGWEMHVDQHSEVYVYRPDVNLTMAYGLALDGDREWEDEELSPGPGSDVRGRWLDVFWAGALVDRHRLYLVDGARGTLPDYRDETITAGTYVDSVGRTATASAVRLARLVHCLRTNHSFDDDARSTTGFDYYFQRSGIIEVPDDRSSDNDG